MKKLLSLLALSLAFAGGVARADDLTDGEVRKVDKAAGKLTLKHGEIRNLEMPPMTMIFVVKDKALLERVKTGDKVRFKAAREGGALVVTELQPAGAAPAR
ncbi:MAG: copper-binding protein [Proteobacteria bacterium]|nr:copper-binding protein [Pseudomonadota bacterium]